MASSSDEWVRVVREGLAVARTSVYLLRKHLDGVGAVDAEVEKHLSRIEESLGRATLALTPELKTT
ncbi:MAG TPA: hypothetical protein VHO06_01180 [Polyangia bacterium]|nr:hypothetical protein [Polyangia bacterium]